MRMLSIPPRSLYLAILSFACVAALAQAPATESRDAKALMLRAAASNGLTSDDTPPWHLRASYKLLDDKGGITDQGTIEEFWMGPKKFKRVLRDASFEQTDFGTATGVLRSGETANPPYLVFEIERVLIEPMQERSLVDIEDYDLRMIEASSGKLDCLSMKDADGNRFGDTWYLSAENSVLRLTATPQGMQVIRNGIVDFGEHLVAIDMVFVHEHKTIASVHIESIEPLQPADEANVSPTPGALPAKPQGFTPDRVTNGFPIKKVTPINSTLGAVRGTVTLTAIIGKNGRLRDIHSKSGPTILVKAAMDAANQWIYRPYLLNNDPVEVTTTLSFQF
jgi:hypothetical protein